jgi:peroxiredoxin
MTVVRSRMPPLGHPAPDFALPDLDARIVTRNQTRGTKGLLVAFICNHCPYVAHIREAFVEVARRYGGPELGVVAINSNDAGEFPDDSRPVMRDFSSRYGYPFPYLVDGEQTVALAYRAACTPDFFLYDADLRLFYRGRFDDSRPGNGRPTTGRDLRRALDAVLTGGEAPQPQHSSMGCNIKWRRDRVPAYM